MMRSPETTLLQHLAQLLCGLIALVAVTGACFWLKLPLVSAALTYLIAILLLSFVSSLPSLLVLCAIAAGCLDYFFTSPILSFRIDHPEDVSRNSRLLRGFPARRRRGQEAADRTGRAKRGDR